MNGIRCEKVIIEEGFKKSFDTRISIFVELSGRIKKSLEERDRGREREQSVFWNERTEFEAFGGRSRATYWACGDNAVAMDISPLFTIAWKAFLK